MSRVVVVDVEDGNLFATTDSRHFDGDYYETYLTGHGLIEGTVVDVVYVDDDNVSDEQLEDIIQSHRGGDSQ